VHLAYAANCWPLGLIRYKWYDFAVQPGAAVGKAVRRAAWAHGRSKNSLARARRHVHIRLLSGLPSPIPDSHIPSVLGASWPAVGFAMRHGGNPSYDCAALADRPRLPSGGDTVAAALTTARVTLWEVRFHDLCRAVKGVGARYFGSRFFGLRGLHAGHCSAHSACHLIHCTRHSTGKVKPCGLTSAARIFLELSGRTLAWPAPTLLKIATSKSM
jgi:hypothetical protein